MAVGAATACDGNGGARAFAGEGDSGGEEDWRERERPGGSRGVVRGIQSDEEEARQAARVARGACARAEHTPRLLARGGGRWRWPVGWASTVGPAQCQAAGGPGKHFSILFSFLFSDICF